MNQLSKATSLKAIPRGSFSRAMRNSGLKRLSRAPLSEVQLNLGKLCNQACEHCHVDAGPKRTEIMSWPTMQRLVDWIRQEQVKKVDVTGGAPEINPNFRRLIDALLECGVAVSSRCNLTVLSESGQEDLAQWYADRRIQLVCSLPCYTRENVDNQRGKGIFTRSISGLQKLNAVGYGMRPELVLDLVYNPGGPFLPPPQSRLENDYKRELKDGFGITFNQLLSITNLPINRYHHYLQRTGQLDTYQQLLEDNFNPDTVPSLMCRHLINVDWTGRVYDCDFNQMVELPLGRGPGKYLWELTRGELTGAGIAVGAHCFGCTAGSGSSCSGALT